MMNNSEEEFYDKNGRRIKEFDLIKVFHFIGAHNKKYYLYKWIRKDNGGRLCMKHLGYDKSNLVHLEAVTKKRGDCWAWEDAEIVSYEAKDET